MPREAGLYVGELSFRASVVTHKSSSFASTLDRLPPIIVTLQAVAEHPRIEVSSSFWFVSFVVRHIFYKFILIIYRAFLRRKSCGGCFWFDSLIVRLSYCCLVAAVFKRRLKTELFVAAFSTVDR